jgi:gliding motility-associated-like protein
LPYTIKMSNLVSSNHSNECVGMKKLLLLLSLFSSLVSFGQCSETIDQQQSTSNSATFGSDQWQSFTVGITGDLTKFEIHTNGFSSGNQNYNFSIYQGEGVLGTLLYSGSGIFNTPSGNYFSTVIPPSACPVLAASQYTFRLQVTGTYDQMASNSSNAYPGGVYFSNAYGLQTNWDWRFRSHVTPGPAPIITINGSTNPTCFGDSDGTIFTTASSGTPGYFYNWSPSGSTAANPTGLAAGTHTLTLSDVNGCIDVENVILSNPPQVTADAGVDLEICQGGSVVINGASTNAVSYNWSPPAGLSSTTTLTTTASPTSTTIYILQAQNGSGCIAADAMQVTVNPLPTVSAGSDQIVCAGTAVTLTGTGTATGYSWNNGVTDGTSFNPGLGSVNYTVTGTDGNGCVNTDVVNVTVNPNPLSSLACSDGDQIICAGDLVTFTATGATNYEFFVNAISIGPASPASNYSTSTLNNGDVVTMIGESGGCTFAAPETYSFTVNALPAVSFSVLPAFCLNSSAHTLTEGSPAGGVYTGTGVSGTIFTPSSAGTGNHTLTYSYTDGNGCSAIDQETATVSEIPAVDAGIDDTICIGSSTTIAATSANTYSWDNGLGTAASHIVSPITTTLYTVTGTDLNGCQNTDGVLIVVNPLPTVNLSAIPDQCVMGAPYSLSEGSPAGGNYSGTGVTTGAFSPSTTGLGTYQIYYDYTDGNGCYNIDSNTVLVYNNPTVVANANAVNLCDGEQLTLTGSGATTYIWDNGVSDGIAFTPAIGTINYSLLGTDANGCFDSSYVSVTVNPLPTIIVGGDQSLCEGVGITLAATGASTYIWDNGITDNTSFIPPVGTTTYTVVGTDANGCENTANLILTVNPNPVITVSANQFFCAGDDVTLSATGAPTFDWDGGLFTGPEYLITPANSVLVDVIGTSSLGCTTQAFVDLTLDDPTLIDAGLDQSICLGFTANLSASGGVSYIWSGPSIVDETTESISFGVDSSAYYYVVIETPNGCFYTDSLYVESLTDASCTIDVVFSITPNNDDVNDTWRIQGIEGFPDNNVSILNRWGDVVFQAAGYDNDLIVWDGTHNGNELGAGTYFFVIEIANGPSRSGWIQLMK